MRSKRFKEFFRNISPTTSIKNELGPKKGFHTLILQNAGLGASIIFFFEQTFVVDQSSNVLCFFLEQTGRKLAGHEHCQVSPSKQISKLDKLEHHSQFEAQMLLGCELAAVQSRANVGGPNGYFQTPRNLCGNLSSRKLHVYSSKFLTATTVVLAS